ncbi:hypothetical protein B1L11_28940 [Microbispora sp. GKU 823]|nr:hypothetical protein B1L11_28940 [Microbispora sp. GKU 823]
MAGLDVGSGTGRFTPALARAFGPVTGVEPSVRMRETAQAQSRHPGVRYLIWWLDYFPRGFEVDASMFQPLHEVIETFTSAGWRVAGFGTVTEPSSGTRGEMLERLRLRTHSVFAQFTPGELKAGFRRLERAVAADPGAPAPAARSGRGAGSPAGTGHRTRGFSEAAAVATSRG